MDNLYWLDQITSSDLPTVGEKAFGLSQLLQQDYPVLPGFVIPVSWWHDFLNLGDNSDPLLADFPESSLYIDVDNTLSLQQFAQRMGQTLRKITFPPPWQTALKTAIAQLSSPTLIVRPSFIQSSPQPVSMRGLYHSQICASQEEALETACKDVWSQIFQARSLFYWYRQKIPLSQIQGAILVQPLGAAIASGIVHVTPQHWNIESTWGLGHSLVQGEVLPDHHQVNPETGQVITQELGNKLRVYRPNSTLDGLSAEILPEQAQENYALSEPCLQQLVKILENLVTTEQATYDLEWIWSLLGEEQTPQLFLTQWTPQSFLAPPKQRDMEKMPESMADSGLWQGLGASPGKVVAISHFLTGVNHHVHKIPEGRILVSQQITPDWLPLLQQAAGLITETGGLTSHGAIMARQLGIPAVVGVPQITQKISHGEQIMIDGDRGIIQPTPVEEDTFEDSIPDQTSFSPSIMTYPLGTQLLVNLHQKNGLENLLQLPIDGIGLMRGEWLILDLLSDSPFQGKFSPYYTDLLIQKLQDFLYSIVSQLSLRPLSYRVSDRRILKQANVGKVDFLAVELEALRQLQQRLPSPIHLILPFIRSVEEFKRYRHQIEKTGLLESNTLKLWMMVEVPASIFLLPEYCQAGVQGFAIGSNDLIALLLGMDRERISSGELNELHPGVLNALQKIIHTAKTLGVPCSICGHAPVSSPQLIDHLVQWGITAISVESEAVGRTYQAIARAEQRLLLDAARQLSMNSLNQSNTQA